VLNLVDLPTNSVVMALDVDDDDAHGAWAWSGFVGSERLPI
jgi:hypothetical protein